MRMLARLLDVLALVMRLLAGFLLLASVCLNAFNIADRFLVSSPIQWGEEIMLFLMVGIVFSGAVAISAQGRHIRMDMIVALTPRPVQRAFHLLAVLCEGGAAAFVVWISVPVVEQLAAFNERADASNMPIWIPQSVVPVGLGLIAVICLTRIMLLLAGHRATAIVGTGPSAAETAALAGE